MINRRIPRKNLQEQIATQVSTAPINNFNVLERIVRLEEKVSILEKRREGRFSLYRDIAAALLGGGAVYLFGRFIEKLNP